MPFRLALPNRSVTGAETKKAVFACAVAVIVIPDLGGEAGALYSPFASIVPWTASPPWTPFTLQLTALLVLPVTVTVGVNC